MQTTDLALLERLGAALANDETTENRAWGWRIQEIRNLAWHAERQASDPTLRTLARTINRVLGTAGAEPSDGTTEWLNVTRSTVREYTFRQRARQRGETAPVTAAAQISNA